MWSWQKREAWLYTRVVRRGLGQGTPSEQWLSALDTLVREELWRDLISSRQTAYTDFWAFARDAEPFGLGANDRNRLNTLRTALLALANRKTTQEAADDVS